MTNDAPDEPSAPDLRKPEPEPTAPPASIWERLDGTPTPAPQAPQVPPGVGAWGAPHGAQFQPVPPHVAAAAYTQHAQPGGPVFTLASWGRRLGAYLIDGLLFGMIALALVMPVGLWQGLTADEAIRFFSTLSGVPDSVTAPAILWVAFVVQRLIVGIIPALFLTRWNGQTPGKRALGIRVMCADGSPMTSRVAFTRELFARAIVIDTLTAVTFGVAGALNYLWPLWDTQRRTGHDAIAGTRVVRLSPEELLQQSQGRGR